VGTGDLDPTGESQDDEEDDLDFENSTGLDSSGVLTLLLLVDSGEILFLSAEMPPPLLLSFPWSSSVEESPLLSLSDTFAISALPPRLAAPGDSDNAVLCVAAPLTLAELAAVSLLAPPCAANFSDSATSSVMLRSVLAALSKVVAPVLMVVVEEVGVGVTVVVVVERVAGTGVVRVVALILAVALMSQTSSASLAVTERAVVVVVERVAVVASWIQLLAVVVAAVLVKTAEQVVLIVVGVVMGVC
jgi:hypothetical protein